ncbi:PepSY domain-containing protein [Brevundimonas bacteroides]|uniref:PepSY domain-containing protein n=1 Tax=Brevundimonas bacteroides TaxID=74311 RepID=UPI000497AFC7|nr:PepSY domain-containing protein [Brevundimonas bacteroides]
MSRATALALAALIAAAPLSTAQAQARVTTDVFGLGASAVVGLGQDRDRRGGNDRDQDGPRLMSEAQALSIAQRRAGGARFVGSLGLRGTTYVFRFERDGQIIDIAVDARGG